jgi:hypothetical protein
MPKIISTAREVAYVRALAETGNATLAAEVAALAKARLAVRVNRDELGGWTAAQEAQFLERLEETCSVWLAAAEVGVSTVSAYRRRQVRSRFAAAWEEAQRIGWPPADRPWIESAVCFFEGRPPPPGNPVRITSIGEVIEAMRGNRFAVRRPQARKG